MTFEETVEVARAIVMDSIVRNNLPTYDYYIMKSPVYDYPIRTRGQLGTIDMIEEFDEIIIDMAKKDKAVYFILVNPDKHSYSDITNTIVHELYHVYDSFTDKSTGLSAIFSDREYTLYNTCKKIDPSLVVDKFKPLSNPEVTDYEDYIFNDTELWPRIQYLYRKMVSLGIICEGGQITIKSLIDYIIGFDKLYRVNTNAFDIRSNEIIPFIFRLDLTKIDKLNDYILK